MKKKSNIITIILGSLLSVFFLFIIVKRVLKKGVPSLDETLNILSHGKIAKTVYKDSEEKKKSSKLSTRQTKILDLIKEKTKITMEDLSKKISGVHERTLRRELSKLDDLGLIKKTGKTKGSFYTLK